MSEYLRILNVEYFNNERHKIQKEQEMQLSCVCSFVSL